MPDTVSAVQAMRSYLQTLTSSSLDTSALSSWIDRNANPNVQRNDTFPPDAAVAVLHYFGHPLYTSSNMTQEQMDWAALMASAEQIIGQENAWANGQIALHNATMFIRAFSTDHSWLAQWAASVPLPPNYPDEYILNALIEALRTCQGSSNNGAGSIPHETYSLPFSEEPR
jgi:hypothetical protein